MFIPIYNVDMNTPRPTPQGNMPNSLANGRRTTGPRNAVTGPRLDHLGRSALLHAGDLLFSDTLARVGVQIEVLGTNLVLTCVVDPWKVEHLHEVLKGLPGNALAGRLEHCSMMASQVAARGTENWFASTSLGRKNIWELAGHNRAFDDRLT